MEQEEQSVSGQEKVNDSIDYIEAIREIKQNSVTRDSYNKLKEENQKLLNALVKGEKIEVKQEEPANIQELRKKLFENKDNQLTNLEYVSTALNLRNALIENGERDPFLPCGDRVNITANIQERAAAVAEVLQECVDFADGDSGIFTAELQRRTKDVMPMYKRR